jgi:predicted nucleic acid-binding protein
VIFVDTLFWVAARARRDRPHREAAALVERFERKALFTTNRVGGETWTLLRRRGGHQEALAFLDMTVQTPRLKVMFVGEAVEREGLEWLRHHDERPYSFVDATSFAVMRSLRIREALAFDVDFTAACLVELRA